MTGFVIFRDSKFSGNKFLVCEKCDDASSQCLFSSLGTMASYDNFALQTRQFGRDWPLS